jgi:hypothetical protein
MTCPQEALESSGIFLELWKAICMYIWPGKIWKCYNPLPLVSTGALHKQEGKAKAELYKLSTKAFKMCPNLPPKLFFKSWKTWGLQSIQGNICLIVSWPLSWLNRDFRFCTWQRIQTSQNQSRKSTTQTATNTDSGRGKNLIPRGAMLFQQF